MIPNMRLILCCIECSAHATDLAQLPPPAETSKVPDNLLLGVNRSTEADEDQELQGEKKIAQINGISLVCTSRSMFRICKWSIGSCPLSFWYGLSYSRILLVIILPGKEKVSSFLNNPPSLKRPLTQVPNNYWYTYRIVLQYIGKKPHILQYLTYYTMLNS